LFKVPIVTDIVDADIVRAFKAAVEDHWHVRAGQDDTACSSRSTSAPQNDSIVSLPIERILASRAARRRPRAITSISTSTLRAFRKTAQCSRRELPRCSSLRGARWC
jgi:hypothetical protein